nr:hypothetical protein Iba_chr07dCG12380 [Ipomoea batatas]
MGSACSCFGLMSKVQVVFCGVGTHGQSRHHADRYQSVTSSNNQEVIPNNNNPSLRSSNNQEVEVVKLLNVTRLMTRIAVVPNAEVEAHEKLIGKTGRIRLDNVEPKKPLLTFDVVPGSVQLSNDDIEDVCPTCLEGMSLTLFTFYRSSII